MAAPTLRGRIQRWGVEHPARAALVAWAVPVLLLLPVPFLVAATRDNSSIVAIGLPMLLAAPVVTAAVLFGALKQERERDHRAH